MTVVHVVGAGVAGLACAVDLAGAGVRVNLYEAAGQAGGRCRSYFEPALGRQIDNGNHLLLSGNHGVRRYLDMIGARDQLTGPEAAVYPFLDVETGERWTVRPSPGPVPWWLFDQRRRVPATRPATYLRGVRLAWAPDTATVAECLDDGGPLFRRFWEPLAVAVLNTPADEGQARLLWPVLRRTFGRGEAACRPRVARHGLSRTFVDPALTWLGDHGGRVHLNRRLRGVTLGERVESLEFGTHSVELEAADVVVLALPPMVARDVLPGLIVPEASQAIVNGHFMVETDPGHPAVLGIIGGTCQWLFVRDGVASVTVSAAGPLADVAAEDIAGRMWTEVTAALNLGDRTMPPWRIVKEKRATFAQTPDQVARRPPARTRWSNLFLAGDWTDTGLPATIEGAVLSGFEAARLATRTAPAES